MTLTTLLPQTSTVGATGPNLAVAASAKVDLQFNPQASVGFSGIVLVQGSSVGSPGANDWTTLATLTFTAQTTNFVIDMYPSTAWIRILVSTATVGAVSAYALS